MQSPAGLAGLLKEVLENKTPQPTGTDPKETFAVLSQFGSRSHLHDPSAGIRSHTNNIPMRGSDPKERRSHYGDSIRNRDDPHTRKRSQWQTIPARGSDPKARRSRGKDDPTGSNPAGTCGVLFPVSEAERKETVDCVSHPTLLPLQTYSKETVCFMRTANTTAAICCMQQTLLHAA